MTPLAYSKTYNLPGGITAEFCLNNGRLECAWSPEMPRGKKAKKLLPHYRAARNDFLGSLGMNVAVIEL